MGAGGGGARLRARRRHLDRRPQVALALAARHPLGLAELQFRQDREVAFARGVAECRGSLGALTQRCAQGRFDGFTISGAAGGVPEDGGWRGFCGGRGEAHATQRPGACADFPRPLHGGSRAGTVAARPQRDGREPSSGGQHPQHGRRSRRKTQSKPPCTHSQSLYASIASQLEAVRRRMPPLECRRHRRRRCTARQPPPNRDPDGPPHASAHNT